MKANSLLISTSFKLLSFSLLAVIVTGCQQPYSYSPYGQYQPNPYGQPAFGQPMGQPMPPGYAQPGMIAPGSGTVVSPGSTIPPGNNWQAPSTGGDSAPKFDPQNPGIPPGHQVPKYNDPSSGSGTGSPYFESRSTQIPENTFVSQPSNLQPGISNVSQADFTQTAQNESGISLTAGEQSANFELPTRPATPSQLAPTATTDPFTVPQKIKPISSEIPLAPPLATKKNVSASDFLEGTARKIADPNQWVLEFASSGDPFGGKLHLTGTPEVLRLLKDGRQFRLQGYLESRAGTTQSQFHIEQVHHLQSPFAPTK